MAKLSPKPAAGNWQLDHKNWREDIKRIDQMFDVLQAESDKLKPSEIVSGLIRWGRGDGYALYRVCKDKPLTLEHVPFGDAWTVEAALIRGLNRQDVLEMLGMRRLFSKKAS